MDLKRRKTRDLWNWHESGFIGTERRRPRLGAGYRDKGDRIGQQAHTTPEAFSCKGKEPKRQRCGVRAVTSHLSTSGWVDHRRETEGETGRPRPVPVLGTSSF